MAGYMIDFFELLSDFLKFAVKLLVPTALLFFVCIAVFPAKSPPPTEEHVSPVSFTVIETRHHTPSGSLNFALAFALGPTFALLGVDQSNYCHIKVRFDSTGREDSFNEPGECRRKQGEHYSGTGTFLCLKESRSDCEFLGPK